MAEYIDVSSVAENIEVDEDAVIEGLDYTRLAKALITSIASAAKANAEAEAAAKAKETQPA